MPLPPARGALGLRRTARLKGPVRIRGTMGKHENRVVGAAVLVEIVFAALLLIAGYLAR